MVDAGPVVPEDVGTTPKEKDDEPVMSFPTRTYSYVLAPCSNYLLKNGAEKKRVMATGLHHQKISILFIFGVDWRGTSRGEIHSNQFFLLMEPYFGFYSGEKFCLFWGMHILKMLYNSSSNVSTTVNLVPYKS